MSTSNNQEAIPLIPRARHQNQLGLYFILASTLFDRIAFNALINILFTSLQLSGSFDWDSHHSQTALFIFSGTTYISTLIFAILSDAKFRRAITIIIGFALCLIGYTLVTITASGKTSLCLFDGTVRPNATVIGEEKCAASILGTLIFTAIGIGAVRSNIVVFGAEQIQESEITSHYFDKYVVVVNIGSIIAVLVFPYIQNTITIEYYYVPYLVATSMVFLAGLLFLIGWRYYIHVQPKETVVTNFIPVIINAFQSWYRYRRNINSISVDALSDSQRHIQQEYVHGRSSTFLDNARLPKGKFHNRTVDDVKSLRKAIIVFALLIPYWLVYDQVNTTFLSQGGHMKRPSNAEYIVSWMSLGNSVTVIIGIVIFNKFVYKYLEAQNQTLTIVNKFVIGMFFASIAMCVTGLVEILRQLGCTKNSKCSSLSIYTQLPQNILMGFSQIFAVVASFEYVYIAAPLSGQSLFMSLNFCSIGVSSFISAAYINVFPSPNVDLDFDCQKDRRWYWGFYTYFFILAGFQFIFTIVFVVCQKKFKIVRLNLQQLIESQFHRQTSSGSNDEQ